MNRTFRNTIILGSAAIAILFFQNCSNVKFGAATDDPVSKIGLMNDDGDQFAGNPASDIELRATCQNLIGAQGVTLADGASITDSFGNTNIKAAGNLNTIARVYGNIFITGSGGTITSIDNSHGNIVICGMNVSLITNSTHGNLTVIGGDIGDINSFNGNLRIVDGQITGSITNSNGNILGQ